MLIFLSLILFSYFTYDSFCSYQPLWFKIVGFQSWCVCKFISSCVQFPIEELHLDYLPLVHQTWSQNSLNHPLQCSSSFSISYVVGRCTHTHSCPRLKTPLSFFSSSLSLVASNQSSKITESSLWICLKSVHFFPFLYLSPGITATYGCAVAKCYTSCGHVIRVVIYLEGAPCGVLSSACTDHCRYLPLLSIGQSDFSKDKPNHPPPLCLEDFIALSIDMSLLGRP